MPSTMIPVEQYEEYRAKKERDQDREPNNVLVDFVLSRFSEWEQARSELEGRWDEYYRMFRCLEDAGDASKTSERSRIKIPASREAVNNAADGIYQIEFSSDTWFRVLPSHKTSPEDYELRRKQAQVVQQYLGYLFRQENFKMKALDAIIDKCIYGTTFARVAVVPKKHVETRKIQTPTYDPVSGQPVMSEVAQRVESIFNRPVLRYIPIHNFYVDPYADGLQHDECEGVIVRGIQKDYELRRLKRDGGIDFVPEDLTGGADRQETKEYRLQMTGIYAQPGSSDVETLEYWGWVPGEKIEEYNKTRTKDMPEITYDEAEGGAEVVVIVGNQQHLLKASNNPNVSGERPFVYDVYERTPGMLYGAGVMEAARGPQKALDATVRCRIDNKALAINQMFAINFDKMLPGQNLKTYAGKAFLFHGNPAEAMMPLVIPDVTGGTYNDTAEYQRFIEKAHGISPLVGGMPSKSSQQTATEVSTLMAQSGAKIKMLVERFESNFLEPILKWYVRILLQHMKSPEQFAVVTDNGEVMGLMQVTPEDVSNDYDFVLLGSSGIAARQEFQKRSQMLQLVSNPVLAPFANLPYMIRSTYESTGLDDVELAIATTPPPGQMATLQATQGMPGQASQPAQTQGPTGSPNEAAMAAMMQGVANG